MARLGKTDPRDYLLGRGRLYLSTNLDASGRPKEYRFLGNAEAFTVTIEAEELEHYSSQAGLKTLDRSVVMQQSCAIATQLTEIDMDNLASFMSGSKTSLAQGSGSVAGNDNVVTSGLDRWYDLYDVAAPSGVYPPTTGNRVYRITNLVVKNAAGAVTYVLGTDYEADLVMGRIFPLSTGAIGASDTLDVSFDKPALSIAEVRGLSVTSLVGAVKFVSENANDGSAQREYQFHSVSLRAEGDFGLLGDEFATLNLKGKCGQNATAYPSSPTCTVRDVSNAA